MLPLSSFRIIDLSRALAGPLCTALLADLGADIIKVESGRGGDPARAWPPFEAEHSLYFDSVNRNKRSIALDLYSPAGTAILDRLIAGADALVENFKPGTLDAMGYTEARLRQLNPRLVVASVTGYGTTGPLSDRPGLDQVIQAVSGITSVTGPAGSSGYRVGLPIVDLTSGMTAAIGLLAALLGRERQATPTGSGEQGGSVDRVATSLYETALSLSVFQGQAALTNGTIPQPQGNDHPSITPYGVFDTLTEPIVVAVTTASHWRSFCTALGSEELFADPRFESSRGRTEHRESLNVRITELLAARGAAEWIAALNDVGIPCGAIQDYQQVLAHPQTAALGMIRDTVRGDGSELKLLRGPLTLDGEPTGVHRPPPGFGEHGVEVLRELGLAESVVTQLIADAVLVGVPATPGAQ
ncbi:CaiB/BaiF CoA transferase family protein [Leucobacter komagatae]|uniref:CoA-transferase n=1 Tax=Leucobacter komagatae TaxID=55969 RepID=A0A0D0H4I4_9MICO|nr:CoA transferase [Leucobacter komagatae]KIP52010.1 CoA-transferase [Leucobacter komagatae]